MPTPSLTHPQATKLIQAKAILIDLRPIDAYLSSHVRGSIPLLYEDGPGLGSRARDLLPLDRPLIILAEEDTPFEDAASSFKGKGMNVSGAVPGGLLEWPAAELARTPVVHLDDYSGTLVDVADPGADGPSGIQRVPAESIWTRSSEIAGPTSVGVVAGWGVWAAAAIGILENLGFENLTFVRTLPEGAKPPMAGPEVFRVGA